MQSKYQEIKVFYINISKRIRHFYNRNPLAHFITHDHINAGHSYFCLGKSSKAYNS